MIGKRKKEAQVQAPVPAAQPLTKYIFEADKCQLEKPTERRYVSCAPARVSVFAASEAEAKVLAKCFEREKFAGTGVILGEASLIESYAAPVDWSYGYGSGKKSGKTGTLGDLVGKNVIR